MKFDQVTMAEANAMRLGIQANPALPTVDHGESAAIVLWWTFLMDHAECRDVDLEDLARAQFEAFLPWALENLRVVQTN